MQNFQCNYLDLCQNDLFYPPLVTDLYSIPVNVFCTSINQNSVNPKDLGIVDTRSDHQKMSSILRICSQILSKDELEVWNDLSERFLENATRYESGIPKIRADMLAEIKQFRISKKEKSAMEDQLKKSRFLISKITNLYQQSQRKSHQLKK